MENKGILTKISIRKAAFKLFLSDDYNAVPLKAIEEKSNLSRGCLCYHYPSKMLLFVDVIDHYVLHKQDIRQKVHSGSRKSLLQFIKTYVDTVDIHKRELSPYLEEPTNSNITRAYLNLIAQAQRYYPDFDRIANAVRTNEIHFWTSLIKKAQESGEIRADLDALSIAQQFRYIFFGKSYDDSLEHGLNVKDLENQYMFLYNIIKK